MFHSIKKKAFDCASHCHIVSMCNCRQGQVVWKLVTDRQNPPLPPHCFAWIQRKITQYNVQLSFICPKVSLLYIQIFINTMWAPFRWFWVIYDESHYTCKRTLFIRCIIRKKNIIFMVAMLIKMYTMYNARRSYRNEITM